VHSSIIHAYTKHSKQSLQSATTVTTDLQCVQIRLHAAAFKTERNRTPWNFDPGNSGNPKGCCFTRHVTVPFMTTENAIKDGKATVFVPRHIKQKFSRTV